jgi:hypothetical protein
MFDRATTPRRTNPPAPILYQGEVVERKAQDVQPCDVAPGVVPVCLVGRKPKCCFGLLKSFIGTSLMGFSAQPEQVHLVLKSNPAFARVCSFSHKEKDRSDYHYQQVPSLRKLEQFGQIMTDAGVWDPIKLSEVETNLATGVIRPEQELVGDTTHYHAYSSFETVRYDDDKGEKKLCPATGKRNGLKKLAIGVHPRRDRMVALSRTSGGAATRTEAFCELCRALRQVYAR